MTAGAYFRLDEIPVIFSDLLATRDGYTGFKAAIPTHLMINSRLPLDAGFEVVGLRQKLVVINERLTVVFAGDAEQAANIFEVLRAASRSPSLDGRELEKIISAIEPQSYSNLQAILIMTTPSEHGINSPKIEVLCLDARPIVCDRISDGFAIGSGRDELVEMLPKAVSHTPIATNSVRQRVVNAEGLALWMAGGFMGYEYWGAGNLLKRWGGGFEAATFRNGSFQKLDKITHLFWRVYRDTSGLPQIEQRAKVMHQEYQDGFLVFRNVEVMTEDEPEGRIHDSIHVVTNFEHDLQNLKPTNVEVPEFTPNVVCNHVLIAEEFGMVHPVMTDISWDDQGLDWVDVMVENGRLEIGVKRELCACLVASIHRKIGIDLSHKFSL